MLSIPLKFAVLPFCASRSMKEFIQTSIAENGSNSFLRGGSQKYPAGPERRLPKDGSKKRRAGGGQADLPDPEVVERIKAHLDVLGLALDASPSAGDIKRAYRELALKCHPDKTGNDEALSETFKKINDIDSISTLTMDSISTLTMESISTLTMEMGTNY